MTSEVQVYEHPTFGSLRVIEEDGQAFTVASDLAHMLGHRDAANMLRNLDEDEKGTRTVSTPGGPQQMAVVTEAGMYHAILMRKSACVKDPEARTTIESFQRWVTHQVLPTIHRTGAYVNPYGAETREELLARANLAIQEVLAEREERIRVMEPMAALGEAVSAASNCIEVGALARLLRQNGCEWAGRGRLFGRLRDDGYLMDIGARHNLPYQRWIEQGLFEVQEVTYSVNGEVRTRLKTMVTPKGQAYFLKRYAGVDGPSGLEVVA